MPLPSPITDSPESREHRAKIREQSFDFAQSLLHRFCAPLPRQQPFDWCVANLILDDPDVKGPFNPVGREYLRDPINDNNDDDVREQVFITGTGVGKTLTNIAGIAWKIVHHPCRGLMVMPATKGEGGSETFATSRLIPALEASPRIRELMPDGQRRFMLNSKRVRFNGAHFGFVGANSSSQIASNRCGDIRMDEADKYKGKLGDEAGTASLVKERVEGVLDYQIFLNTTPTVEERLGWKTLMRSDFRRRFLPCPHCNNEARGKLSGRLTSLTGWMDLAWSEQYCVLPMKFLPGGAFEAGTIIPRAYIRWDKEAKRPDGSFDMARVFRSARFQCPHCGGHIRDKDKIQMDKNGIWLPLQAGTPHHRGYHLSSLYAPPLFSNENSLLGGRALKFLNAREDGEGMKGFINSTLAEVDVMQELGRIEINSAQNFAQTDWIPLMSVDFQKLHPFIWFLVQKFSTFKLQPPIKFTEGKPDFVTHLDKNPKLKSQCEKLISGFPQAWTALAEILRFDPCTGEFPPLDWLIANGITGDALVKLYRETCAANTMDFGRYIFREMGRHVPKGGDSEIIAAGYCELSGDDAWQELREIQQQYHVGEPFRKNGISPNRAVMIDSGYAEEHNPEVLRKCFESGFQGRWHWYDPATKTFSPFKMHGGCLAAPVDCWIPFKGYPITKRWRVDGSEASTHWGADDPFKGLAEAEKYRIQLLEAASEWYFHKWMDNRDRQKQILEAIAANKSYRGNLWNVSNQIALHPQKRFTREDFERQMNAKGRNSEGEIWERGQGGAGKRKHPDHLNDCARNIYALAEVHGFFNYEPQSK